MLKWRTSVATLPRSRYAASTVVAVVLVPVYHTFFLTKQNHKAALFFRFDLFNMLLTDMDVGKTVLGEENEAVKPWA